VFLDAWAELVEAVGGGAHRPGFVVAGAGHDVHALPVRGGAGWDFDEGPGHGDSAVRRSVELSQWRSTPRPSCGRPPANWRLLTPRRCRPASLVSSLLHRRPQTPSPRHPAWHEALHSSRRRRVPGSACRGQDVNLGRPRNEAGAFGLGDAGLQNPNRRRSVRLHRHALSQHGWVGTSLAAPAENGPPLARWTGACQVVMLSRNPISVPGNRAGVTAVREVVTLH
jgi:hypothetical protein